MYCRLCREWNPDDYRVCETCGIARGRGDIDDLPEGWEASRVEPTFLQKIDEEYDLVYFQVKVYTAHGSYPTHRSPPFKREFWPEWEDYPPPPLTEEKRQMLETLRQLALEEGWHEVINSAGQPAYKFWRRIQA